MTTVPTLSAVLLVSTTTLCLACAPEHTARASTTQAQAAAPATATAPGGHYCNMGFFTPESGARHKALVPKLAAAVTETEELENGYVIKFSGHVREAGEWLDGVRGCCPTIDYAVTFPAHDGPATMRISGGPGAKEFIREEFAPLFPKKG